MAKPKRTQAQAIEDYPEIERLSLQGLTQKEIAKELSKKRPYTLTQQTISNDMVRLREIWKESAAVDIETEKGKLKAHYEYLIAEAQKAWERSQQDAVTEIEAETEKGTFTTIKREGQAGDPRFLAEIRALRAEYKALFGLDAPKRSELTGAGGAPLNPPAEIETVRTVIKDD